MRDKLSIDSRRASRTHAAIVEAFNDLALQCRYDAIHVSDLVAHAGVGRSTFYEHFRSKDDVLLDAVQPIVLALATAASGRAARSYVLDMVRHLWEHRSRGRPLLGGTTAAIVQRRLAEAIRPHVERAACSADGSAIMATGIAAAQLAMLRCWLAGEATSTVEEMTDRLIACSRLLTADRSDAVAQAGLSME